MEQGAGGDMPGRDAGTVFVAELGDEDDGGRLSGLFAAHCEFEDERRTIDGPEGVTVDQAIAWGRERSDAVLVQVGYGSDGFYSAGERDLTYDGSDEDDPEPILPWPVGGMEIAARPIQSALDGSEQVVLWRVHCRANLDDATWARVVERLLQDDLVVRVEPAVEAGEIAELIVRGRGTRAIMIPLHHLIERSLVELGIQPGPVQFELQMTSDDERVV